MVKKPHIQMAEVLKENTWAHTNENCRGFTLLLQAELNAGLK